MNMYSLKITKKVVIWGIYLINNFNIHKIYSIYTNETIVAKWVYNYSVQSWKQYYKDNFGSMA